jgi:hypothetical protein
MTTHPYAVYQRLTAAGTADETTDAMPRSDADLWKLASDVAPELYPADQPDPIELVDMRAAYNDGRHPNRIDLYRLAALINERGVDAFVDRAGGSIAVIRVGGQHTMFTGEREYAVVAGPGTFRNRYTAYGERDDFPSGPPDGDLAQRGDDPTFRPDPQRFQPLAELADLTVALAHAETDRHTRIAAWLDFQVQAGLNAFWDVIRGMPADAYPFYNGPNEAEQAATFERLRDDVRKFLDNNAASISLTPPDNVACTRCHVPQGQPCCKPDCWGRICVLR